MEESLESMSHNHEVWESQKSASVVSMGKSKIPNSIRKTIKMYSKQNKEDVGKSKISIFLKTFVKQKEFTCGIC